MMKTFRKTVFQFLSFIEGKFNELKKMKNKLLRTCDVCNKSSNELHSKSFWGQRICSGHVSDGTPRCTTCGRFKHVKTKYVNLDGGQLCSDCYSIAILDPQQLEPIIGNVHEFYKSLNLEVNKDIRIMLVDQEEMCKRCGEKPSSTTEDSNGYRRLLTGVTFFPRRRARVLTSITKCSKIGEDIQVEKKTGSSPRNKITILVLFGVPDLLVGDTLADAMMYAWLHLQDQDCRKKIEEKVEEGMCEVMGHKWMERFCSNDDLDHSSYKTYKQGQFKRKLKQYVVESTETHPDIYGQGYREATRAVEKFGFQTTLNHIVQKGSFPHREKNLNTKSRT